MLGTNDCKTVYGAAPGVIGKGIETLLNQCEQYSPDSKVLLISPIYLGDKVYREEYDVEFSEESIGVSIELERVYERIARERNIYFLRAQDYASCSQVDQEHMDEKGHNSLGEAVYQCVKDIL